MENMIRSERYPRRAKTEFYKNLPTILAMENMTRLQIENADKKEEDNDSDFVPMDDSTDGDNSNTDYDTEANEGDEGDVITDDNIGDESEMDDYCYITNKSLLEPLQEFNTTNHYFQPNEVYLFSSKQNEKKHKE